MTIEERAERLRAAVSAGRPDDVMALLEGLPEEERLELRPLAMKTAKNTLKAIRDRWKAVQDEIKQLHTRARAASNEGHEEAARALWAQANDIHNANASGRIADSGYREVMTCRLCIAGIGAQTEVESAVFGKDFPYWWGSHGDKLEDGVWFKLGLVLLQRSERWARDCLLRLIHSDQPRNSPHRWAAAHRCAIGFYVLRLGVIPDDDLLPRVGGVMHAHWFWNVDWADPVYHKAVWAALESREGPPLFEFDSGYEKLERVVEITEAGGYNRDELLALAVHRIGEIDHPREAGWWVHLLEKLSPSEAEWRHCGNTVIDLLNAPTIKAVDLGLKASRKLLDRGAVEAATLVPLLSSAAGNPSGPVAKAAVSLLRAAAKKDKSVRSDAMRTALDALIHPKPAVHDPVLAWLEAEKSWLDEPAVVMAVARLIGEVNAGTATRLKRLLPGTQPAQAQPQAVSSVGELRELLLRLIGEEAENGRRNWLQACLDAVDDKGEVPELTEVSDEIWREWPPLELLASPEETARLMLRATVERLGAPNLTRLFAGVRLAVSDPEREKLRRMLDPVFAFEQKLAENGSDREALLDSQLIERFVVLELAKAWVGLDSAPYPDKSLGAYATHWCPLHLRRHLCATMRALQRSDPRAPLSTPTLQLGWLGPVRLAERLRDWSEFGRDEMFELSSAIYRLPRCQSARDEAWEIIEPLQIQFDDHVRLTVVAAFAPEAESERALEHLADLVLCYVKTSRKNRRPFDPLIASERWIADDWVGRARRGELERPGPEDYLRLLTSAARFRVGLGESPVLARIAKRLPGDFFPVGKGRKLRQCEPGKLLAHPVPITWDLARSLRVSSSFHKVAPELPIESHWDFIEPGFPWVATHASAFPELLSYWWVVNLWGWSHWYTPGDARTYEDAAFEWPRFVNHLAAALSMPPGAIEDKSFRDRLIPCEAVLRLALRQDVLLLDLVVEALGILVSPKPPVDASAVRDVLLTSLTDGRLWATSLIEVMKLFLNARDAAPVKVLSLLRSLGDHSTEFREIVACALEAAVAVGLADVTGAQRVAVLQTLLDLRTAARRGVESPAARQTLENLAQTKTRNRTTTLARELLQLPATPAEVPSSRTVSAAHDVTSALRWSSAYSGSFRKFSGKL